jgi:hypothetical protein
VGVTSLTELHAADPQKGPLGSPEYASGQPASRRGRPRWPWVAGAAVVCAAVVAALVLSLSPGHPTTPTVGSGPSPRPAGSGAKATVGNLLLAQLRVGDCLTGANMQLNTTDPWPKLTSAVPCSRPHTAEVFFADNNFWPNNGPYPGGNTINKDGNAACDSAFQSYVGIPYTKSMYTWTNIIPDASTWLIGDRGLHCIAYYATPKQPTGVPITGTIRDTRQ